MVVSQYVWIQPNPIHNSNSRYLAGDVLQLFVTLDRGGPIQYTIPIRGYLLVMALGCLSMSMELTQSNTILQLVNPDGVNPIQFTIPIQKYFLSYVP